VHLPAEAADVHLPGQGVRHDGHPQAGTAGGDGVAGQSSGPQRAASRVAARGLMAARGSRGGAIRGRTAIAIGLASFLVVTTSVVWRRARGSTAAIRLHELGARIDELHARRARLEGEVRRASSQVELVPRMQRLGLRLPSDSQVIHLPDPVRR
jgi:hypothetical protein